MSYEYVKQAYNFEAKVGQRVRHDTAGEGVIARENKSCGHYVMVKFDGRKHSSPCHPGELHHTQPKNRSSNG